jgi:hypothetical protein
MEAQQDFKELLACLNARGVDYMIVGGYALAFHGAPRFTGDLDVWVKPEAENARRVLAALTDFGFGALDLKEEDFVSPDRVVQLGVPPVRVDIITSISGVSWEQAAPCRVPGPYGEARAFYIGRADLIANKRACGRRKDLADIEALEGDAAPPGA